MFRFIRYHGTAQWPNFPRGIGKIYNNQLEKVDIAVQNSEQPAHPCWSSGLPATQRTGVNFAGWSAIGRPVQPVDVMPATLTLKRNSHIQLY